MNGIFIRSATAADVQRITAIYADAVLSGTASYEIEPPTPPMMAEHCEDLRLAGYPYLVAQDAEKTVQGYAYASAFRLRPAYRFIVEDSIYVAPEAKGRGVGRILLEKLIEAVVALDFRQIIAVIGDGHPDSASVRLHEKLGFRHSGRLEGSGYKHQRWLDTVFMQLAINGGANTPPDPKSWPERKFRQER